MSNSNIVAFEISRDSFIDVLNNVGGIVDKKNVIPILSHVKITVEEDHISLSTTDLQSSITNKVNAHVIKKGSFTVESHILSSIIKKLPDGVVRVEGGYESEDSKLHISCPGCDFYLSCLNADDFPNIEIQKIENNFSLTAKSLNKIITKTRFAISNDDTRYYLTGLYFSVKNENSKNNMYAVATDGHRLAMSKLILEDNSENISFEGILVPRRAINEVKKIIDKIDDESVNVGIGEGKIIFTFKDIQLVSKLIDGNFPDYERVIPKKLNHELKVSLNNLQQSVDRISVVNNDKTSNAIKFEISNSNFIIRSVTSNTSALAVENITEFDYDSDNKIEIGFNYKYVMDVLRNIESDTVNIKIVDSMSSILFFDSGSDSELYLIMPVKI